VSWRGLRYKGTERLTSREWNAVVDALNDLYGRVATGTQDIYVDAVYGNTGYFSRQVYVQGKPVIKDGDPVSIYQFFDPAVSQMVYAIEGSRATRDLDVISQYTKDSRDVLVKITFSPYGNIGVKIAEPLDLYGRVATAAPQELLDEFKPVSASGSIDASSNTAGFSITLNKGGRPNVNVYYNLGGAGVVYLKVSRDGSTWRTLKTYSLSGAGEGIDVVQGIAYPYVRLETPNTGIDVTLEIVASR